MTDNLDADSLLDVFTGVEVEENLISVLSREVSDVSLHSLLEQMRELAIEMERGRQLFGSRPDLYTGRFSQPWPAP